MIRTSRNVWGTAATASINQETLRHLESLDGGRTWDKVEPGQPVRGKCFTREYTRIAAAIEALDRAAGDYLSAEEFAEFTSPWIPPDHS